MAEEIKTGEDGDHWMQAKWRPAMGWMYMAVCSCDFMLFPVLWSLLQSLSHGTISSQWQPLTLQGAGLFHIAMGAVLGIAAYGRTQEKIAGATNTSTTTAAPVVASTPVVNNTIVPANTTPLQRVDNTAPIVGYAGKAAPPPASQPLI